MREENQLIEVASYHWINDAEFARMALEQHSIKCELFNKNITGVDPMLANAVGGIKIKVRLIDAEKATEILKNSAKENDINYKPWCPNCDSENVIKTELNTFLRILSLFTFGYGAVLFIQSFTCKECNHKWS